MKLNINISTGLKLAILAIAFSFQTGMVSAENLRGLVNLKGYWKFSIGDDLSWSIPSHNDAEWERVFVPQTWESNGFQDYNGYAWYRKHFKISVPNRIDFVYLNMGYIDDVDEVYVNGKLVGASGKFPPLVETAFNIPRMYPVPTDILNREGDNVIAVRVFDDYHEGGIVRGDIEIVYDLDQLKMSVDLSGYWDFECSKNVDVRNQSVITYKPGKIFVPGFWEARGYNNMDGKAIYSKEFRYPSDVSDKNQVLLLGVIDDEDEVYLNGEKLDVVRELRKWSSRYRYGGNHMLLRAYEIPENLIDRRGINRIEVIVEDHSGPGGIYKGTIGIVDGDVAMPIIKKGYKDTKSPFEKFIDYWFD
ncbi:glycoside hydrolase [Marinifilum sp. N1E240]|uniref:beta galactosidase jelly roll domain-containing protein n=1 Tax=Marinifilum sp. N1E240 TaxID=2608082 RepID=UPI00128C0670|nr:beta galactosidase jelly roll domain-containing protein [Marinifilum sp. N1E240]MPQ48024.1 glycoside hydrolase [Marinifilum sp. N1E240]